MALKPIRVSIQNYQSLEDVEFDVEGFTCIRGGTNVGKSAILRAISGAILNAPAVGKVRRGYKYATVSLQSEDWGLKWEKGESVSRYWLPGDEKPRTAIGQGQADFVAAMGFQQVRVGDDWLQPWYANQHEPIFLLNRSGPSVTEFISEVSRLKVLQDAITINVRAREQALRDVKASESEASVARTALEPFQLLKSCEDLPSSLESQLESIEEYERKIQEVERILAGLDRETRALEILQGLSEVRVPSAPEAHFERLASASSFLVDLEKAARGVIVVKTIDQVVVPDPPDMERLLAAPDVIEAIRLQDSVREMEAALAGPLPGDGPREEIQALTKGLGLLAALEQAQAGVRAVERVSFLEVPVEPDVVTKLETGLAILIELEVEASQVSSLARQLKGVEEEISSVDEEISSIPTCPTCRQVLPAQVTEHSHAR